MNETKRENNATPFGSSLSATSTDVGRIVSQSAVRAKETLQAHPYFAVGILAGIGIAVTGAIVLGARRRRGFFERMMSSLF